jgi:hypothetical protein
VSNDGRQATTQHGIIDPPRAVPDYYEDDPTTNAAVEDADFSYTLNDESLPPEEEEPAVDGIAYKEKKKRNENSVSSFRHSEHGVEHAK